MEELEIRNAINHLSNRDKIKFTKLVRTFNQKGGAEKQIRATLHAINTSSPQNESILSKLKNMIGGVLSNRVEKLKNFITPAFLNNVNKDLSKHTGGNSSKENNSTKSTQENTTHSTDARLNDLEEAVSKLNNLNNNNNNRISSINQSGGNKKKKPKSTKPKSKSKSTKPKSKSKSTKHKPKSTKSKSTKSKPTKSKKLVR
jgi:hypothetical protein